MSGNDPRLAGSPTAGEPVFSTIGRIRRPHGVRGELLVELFSNLPDRFDRGVVVYVGENHEPLQISSKRGHKGSFLLSFEGINNPEQAGRLRNCLIYCLVGDRPPLPAGSYYYDELLGMQVLDEAGHLLGQLAEILETGANDVYVVARPEGGEILLPATAEVVLEVNIPRSEMRVHLLPGLVNDE